MQVEFVGQSERSGGNSGANTSRLVNFYREAVNGSETVFSLRSVLGQTAFADLSNTPRSVHVLSNVIYALSGGSLKSVSSAGSVSQLAVVADSAAASMSSNLGSVTISSGGVYQVWNGTTLATPATGNFADIGSVDYLKGYTVYTQQDGRKWGWSDILDPATLPALNFATAEARDDNCIRVLAVNNNAWLFKDRSIEVWYPTGQSGANAFYPLGGGVSDIGLKSYNLITRFPGGAFFIGHDNVAYVTIESSVKGVTDNAPGVTYSIINESPLSCFYYEDGAHKFVAITFADRPAWCLDITTGEWHERASGDDGAWTASEAAQLTAGWYSIHTTGEIVLMSRSGADVDGPLIRRAQSKTLYTGAQFRVPVFEIFGRVGWGDLDDASGDAREAQAWLRVSGDRGQTWGRELWKSMGLQGEYDTRMIWRSLGQFNALTAEIGCSEPFDVTFNATCDLQVA